MRVFGQLKLGLGLRSETLQVFATLLAAVAAAFSAIAAFRQERATFTSILYGNQIELANNLLNSMQAIDDAVFKGQHELINAALNLHDESAVPIFEKAIDRLSGQFEKLDANINLFVSVAPESFTKFLVNIKNDVNNTIVRWSDDMNQIKMTSSGSKTPVGSSANALSYNPHDPNYQEPPSFSSRIAEFRDCVFAEFRDGRTLRAEKCTFLSP